ncbi:MAG: hypothetical protein R3D58_15880 [Saprospiraceae bacterium]|jgi:hypothetical protein|nr:hypothetical protein [Lewinellaceae bacterium]
MAQVSWVYLDDFGGRHRVGLYHGDKSGHVLLHCDLRVVQVDFSVRESRTYSFFVEDELCEVRIFKEKNGYSYDFNVNKEADTPRNRLRKADNRRNRKYMIFLLLGLALSVTGIFIGLRSWNQQRQSARMAGSSLTSNLSPEAAGMLDAEGKTTLAELYIVTDALQRKVFYGFTTANDHQISGYFYVPDTGQIILPNGFPLTDRDAFTVRYLPASPRIHQVEFEQPAAQTLATYLELARKAEVRAHPDATPAHGLCVAKNTLKHKGWRQLADLIFQSTPPAQNPTHNRDSYLRLVRDPAFAAVLERECWDQ